MKKIGLLVSICTFTLLMGGCAKNVESTPTEDSSEAVSDISEVQNNMTEPAKQDIELSSKNNPIPLQEVEQVVEKIYDVQSDTYETSIETDILQNYSIFMKSKEDDKCFRIVYNADKGRF